MKRYDKLKMRAWALFLLLPFPLLLAAPHSATGEQRHGSRSATVQGQAPTADLLKVPNTTDDYSATHRHAMGDREMTNATQHNAKGVTVFLWIRLSIQRKAERGGREGWTDGEAVRGVGRQERSLWLQPAGTVEERVELWIKTRRFLKN
ncbi:hypothetical protein COCON_G00201870 [Conger conger]|uniref:Secreted protein n=1 Tax=Conger conger TaxID=82655 RepID=A0A9Q1CYJ5_CONCO|nr:hypothetical protein COCON_G00201870 [Conger conger]